MNFIDERTQQFFDDLSRRMTEAEEEAERRRGENVSINRIRSLGNVLKSMSNLYWTTRDAPSQDIKPTALLEDDDDKRLDRQRERMIKAHESITRLRMAGAKANADIGYTEGRRLNDERKTDAEIQYKSNKQENENKKTDAEIDNIHSRSNLADSQASLAEAQADIRRQEAEHLPEKQRQEDEVRRAKAQQSWAAARRYDRQPVPRMNLKTLRQKRGRK